MGGRRRRRVPGSLEGGGTSGVGARGVGEAVYLLHS